MKNPIADKTATDLRNYLSATDTLDGMMNHLTELMGETTIGLRMMNFGA